MTEKNLEGWYYLSVGNAVSVVKATDGYINERGTLVRAAIDQDDCEREQYLWRTPREVWDFLIKDGEAELVHIQKLLAAMHAARAAGEDYAKY